MHAEHYITAVYELINNGESIDVVLNKLHAVLKKKSHEKLYPRIVRGLLRTFERGLSRSHTTVVLARHKDKERLKTEISNTLEHFHIDTSFDTEIDETIIGGFTLKQHDRVIDKSYKRQLVALYRSLTE
jgi:F0F1-type ATP synthase delta subunit